MFNSSVMAHNSNMMYAAELGLSLNDLAVSKSFLQDVLRKMALQLREEKEKQNPANGKLSYYAQLTHSAILNIQAAEDTVSALSLLMAHKENDI